MSEQLLNGAKIGAGIEEMRGKGVAERVDGESSVLVDLREECRHDLLQHPSADPLARARQEVRGAIDPGLPIAQQVVALRLVVAQGEHGVVADWDDALL